MKVRTRFAPSPTGHVHIGNMRAAIYNWLFARHHGGSFLLRVEDTDRERSTPEAIETLLNAMEWLGLDVDEEPLYQSHRMDAHLAAAETLLERGLAYRAEKGGPWIRGMCSFSDAKSCDFISRCDQGHAYQGGRKYGRFCDRAFQWNPGISFSECIG